MMKISVALVCFGLAVTTSLGGEVPQTTLHVLGLGEMSLLSDEAGMAIRGSSSSASAYGGSVVAGQLSYKNEFNTYTAYKGSATTNEETVSHLGPFSSFASQYHRRAISDSLAIPQTPGGPGFYGSFYVAAGKSASFYGGHSAAYGR